MQRRNPDSGPDGVVGVILGSDEIPGVQGRKASIHKRAELPYDKKLWRNKGFETQNRHFDNVRMK